MFGKNKNNKKTDETDKTDKYSGSVKIHTMKDDIEIFANVKSYSVKEEIEPEKKEEKDESKEEFIVEEKKEELQGDLSESSNFIEEKEEEIQEDFSESNNFVEEKKEEIVELEPIQIESTSAEIEAEPVSFPGEAISPVNEISVENVADDNVENEEYVVEENQEILALEDELDKKAQENQKKEEEKDLYKNKESFVEENIKTEVEKYEPAPEIEPEPEPEPEQEPALEQELKNDFVKEEGGYNKSEDVIPGNIGEIEPVLEAVDLVKEVSGVQYEAKDQMGEELIKDEGDKLEDSQDGLNVEVKDENKLSEEKEEINRHPNSSSPPLKLKREVEREEVKSSEGVYDDVKDEDILKIIREREAKRMRLRKDSPFSPESKRDLQDIIPKEELETDLVKKAPQDNHNFFPKINYQENVPVEKPEIKKAVNKSVLEGEKNKDLYEYESKKGGLIYVVLIILIILSAVGGYYYFVIKGNNFSLESFKNIFTDGVQDKINNVVNNNSGNKASNNESGGATYSDGKNFLVIEDSLLNKSSLRTLIDETFVKMNGYNGDQLEFVLIGKDNLPIKLSRFVSAFGINLSKGVVDNSFDNFSIFLSKKNGLKRMGLAINIKNKDLVLEALRGDEQSLLKNLDSILLGGEIASDSKKSFMDGSYHDTPIRFMSLNSNPDLSLDYAIVNNYLVFATSKESGRMIIDKILGNK